jgi:hypothetical protein
MPRPSGVSPDPDDAGVERLHDTPRSAIDKEKTLERMGGAHHREREPVKTGTGY